MSTFELRSNIHTIVDSIQNEQLLHTIYDFLRAGQDSSSGKHWNSLTQHQKDEVFLSFDESENEENLISRDNVIRKRK